MPGTKMQEHSGSEKSVVWSAVDFADEEQRTEMFCMRFASAERAPRFLASLPLATRLNLTAMLCHARALRVPDSLLLRQ